MRAAVLLQVQQLGCLAAPPPPPLGGSQQQPPLPQSCALHQPAAVQQAQQEAALQCLPAWLPPRLAGSHWISPEGCAPGAAVLLLRQQCHCSLLLMTLFLLLRWQHPQRPVLRVLLLPPRSWP